MADMAARHSAKTRFIVRPIPAGRPEADDLPMAPPEGVEWARAAQVSLVGIFVILLFIALDLARAFMVPVTAAFVIGMLLGPVASRASAYGIPAVITAIALWLGVVALFYAVIALLSGPALVWITHAPDIGNTIETKLRVLEAPLAAWPSLHHALLPGGSFASGIDIANLLKSAAVIVTPALGQIVIFFATLFFVLLGRRQLRNSLIAHFEARDARLRAIRVVNDIEHNLSNFLGTVTVINIFVGFAAGVIAFICGLPDPVAWGVLGFVLNYVPYVGALMVEIALFAAGVVTFPSLGYALLAPLLYLGVAIIEGQFITPSIIGRRLTLNPLTVFVSVVFWTWLWGPVGTFLAVPLVITAIAVVDHVLAKEEPVLPG